MKRIGMLYPSSGISELEIEKLLPKGVSLHVTRIRMREPTLQELEHMADSVEEAASLLVDARVDIIAFACTAASLIGGKGYDQKIAGRIAQATGLPATTTTSAVIAALRTLGIERLILVTPYNELITKKEKDFLEEEGFQVLSYQGLGLNDAYQQYETNPGRWYELVKEMDQRQSDGAFISCGGIRVLDVVDHLEMNLGKPVVTSNQALVWHCLRIMGIQKPIPGYGRLLRFPLSNKALVRNLTDSERP